MTKPSCEWMDSRIQAIHEISRELQKLAEIGKWNEDAKWDLREYFKAKKLCPGTSTPLDKL